MKLIVGKQYGKWTYGGFYKARFNCERCGIIRSGVHEFYIGSEADYKSGNWLDLLHLGTECVKAWLVRRD